MLNSKRALKAVFSFDCAASLAVLTAMAPALLFGSTSALNPSAGYVNFFKHTSASDDSYTTSPSSATISFMNSHWARLMTFSGYWDTGNKLSWYPNAWPYMDSYAIYANPSTGSPYAGLLSAHPDWVLRDSNGNPLYIPYNCSGGTCPEYAANITNPSGFRVWWISQAQALFTQSPPFKGIFIDDVNLDLSRVSDGNGNPVTPIDPNTGAPMTNTAWRTYFADFLAQVRAALPGVEIVHNSLWFWDWTDSNIQREIQAADWINLERGVNDSGLTGGTGYWSLYRELQFVDAVHADGKGVIFDGEAPGSATDPAREYSVANYLLISTGQDLVGDMSETPTNWWTGFDTNLGAAVGARYTWNSLWRRDFAGGTALVNPPGASSTTVTLPAPYVRTDGSVVNSITLGAASGAVLRALPAITSLSPASVVAGGGAFTLTVNGADFAPGATVQWGTTALTTIFVSGIQLTASVPASLIASAGTASITVATTAGTSPPATFTITVSGTPAPTATATFLKLDTTTQGNWKGVYGADGYNVISDTAAYPSYVTVTPSGIASWTWSSSTADVRALNKAASTDRIAACWYSGSGFFIDLNLTDGAAHQVALYAVDWDATSRQQSVSILDSGSGAVLNTQNLSAFHNGQYLVWQLSGHVQIRVTNSGAPNAVISGLFFGGSAAPPPSISGTASFVKLDTATQGNWKGVYGADGYNVIGDTTAYPAYVTVTPSSNSNWTWASSSSDVRALSKASSTTDRVAACWYSSAGFTVDLAFSDTAVHQIAVYALDWDLNGRTESVSILDGSGAVLNTQSLSSFQNGQYLIWQVSGHVKIQVTRSAGPNGVISGLFFR